MDKRKVLIDPHHTDLFRSWIMMFEKRLGWEVYRPQGQEWYDQGYYWHPIEAEGRGNLNPFNKYPSELVTEEQYHSQTNVNFRWLPLDRVNEVDLVLCSIDRNEQGFKKLCDQYKIPFWRYTGNPHESFFHMGDYDFFLAANLRYYQEFVESGKVPGMLFFPEFEEELHKFSAPPVESFGCPLPVMRSFINFLYHHPEHSNHQNWNRYSEYLGEFGGTPILHGLGTPPPGIVTSLDVILDLEFDRLGIPEYKDRKTWPNRLTNRGEPSSEIEVADLIRHSNIIFNQKHYDGYGYIPYKSFSIGRPLICYHGDYNTLSAGKILEHMETACFISDHGEEDRKNLRNFLEPERNQKACEKVRKRFEELVNFEEQAKTIASKI